MNDLGLTLIMKMSCLLEAGRHEISHYLFCAVIACGRTDMKSVPTINSNVNVNVNFSDANDKGVDYD